MGGHKGHKCVLHSGAHTHAHANSSMPIYTFIMRSAWPTFIISCLCSSYFITNSLYFICSMQQIHSKQRYAVVKFSFCESCDERGLSDVMNGEIKQNDEFKVVFECHQHILLAGYFNAQNYYSIAFVYSSNLCNSTRYINKRKALPIFGLFITHKAYCGIKYRLFRFIDQLALFS